MPLEFSKSLFFGVIGAVFFQLIVGYDLRILDLHLESFFQPLALLETSSTEFDPRIATALHNINMGLLIEVLVRVTAIVLLSFLFLPLMLFFFRCREVMLASLIMVLPEQWVYLLPVWNASDPGGYWFIFTPLLAWVSFIQVPLVWYPLQNSMRRKGDTNRLSGSALYIALSQARNCRAEEDVFQQLANRAGSGREFVRMLKTIPDPRRVNEQMSLLVALVVIVLVSGLWSSIILVRHTSYFFLLVDPGNYLTELLQPLLIVITVSIGLYRARVWAFYGLCFCGIMLVYLAFSEFVRGDNRLWLIGIGLFWMVVSVFVKRQIYRENLAVLQTDSGMCR